MVNNINIGYCECCNKNTNELKDYDTKGTKLMKTFVNDQPVGEQNIVSSYRLCQECFTLRFTDQETFLKKIRESDT